MGSIEGKSHAFISIDTILTVPPAAGSKPLAILGKKNVVLRSISVDEAQGWPEFAWTLKSNAGNNRTASFTLTISLPALLALIPR